MQIGGLRGTSSGRITRGIGEHPVDNVHDAVLCQYIAGDNFGH